MAKIIILACALYSCLMLFRQGVYAAETTSSVSENMNLCFPCEEKCVIFASENDASSKDDYITTAWECICEESNLSFKKRFEFPSSKSAPELISSQQFISNPPDCVYEFIRLHVNNDDNSHKTYDILYHANYINWDIKILLRSQLVYSFGGSGDIAYLSTYEGVRLLNCRTAKVQPPSDKPLEVLYSFEDKWIVRYHDENQYRIYLFCPKDQINVAKVDLPNNFRPAFNYSIISPDNRFLVLIQKVDLNDVESFKPAILKETDVLLFDFINNTQQRYHTYGYALAGSGVMGYYPMIHITPDNQFQYVILTDETGLLNAVSIEDNHFELVTVDPNTLNATKEPFYFNFSTTPESHDNSNERRVPDYLHVEKDCVHLEHRIAHAFLKYKGLAYEIPVAILDMTVAFSSDGHHFLLKMDSGTESNDFFYGDLKRQILRRVKPPTKGLEQAEVNIYWVPVQETN